jgi:hypothetical protein
MYNIRSCLGLSSHHVQQASRAHMAFEAPLPVLGMLRVSMSSVSVVQTKGLLDDWEITENANFSATGAKLVVGIRYGYQMIDVMF